MSSPSPIKSSKSIKLIIILLLVGLMGLSIWLGLNTGTTQLTHSEIWQALFSTEHPARLIVVDLRLPRLLLALAAGAVLSLGGFFMQAIIRNPLADPYIMGLTAGAGFGVNLLLLGIIPILSFSIWSVPLFAGMGSGISLILVMLLGFRSMFEDGARLLIAGVAVSSIFTAATGVLIYKLADSDQVRQLIFWTFGNLGKANWPAVHLSAGLLIVGLLVAWYYRQHLDLLMLGSLPAQALGMSVRRVKISLLLWTSLVVGGTVAFTGPIGFVGMMIPHFSRSLFGASHRQSLWSGTLLGAVYLLLCDLLSRALLPPSGLPIGIVTAILGVPFFLYLLFKRKSVL